MVQDPIGPDSGTYRCNVKNEYGESNANLNLNIEAEPEPEGDPPVFIEKPRIRSENGGKLVIMDCKVKADPKPDIVWYHEGKVLKQSSKLSWTLEEKQDTYYIRLELKVCVMYHETILNLLNCIVLSLFHFTCKNLLYDSTNLISKINLL